jgi:lipoprotein-anchoring transpeptidase ErfK/SrfK
VVDLVVPMAADHRPRRAGSGSRLVLAAAALLVFVTGCSSSGHSSAVTPAAPSTTASPTAADPVVKVAATGAVSYTTPVKVTVTSGSFTSVRVSAADASHELDGALSGDGSSWVSQDPPKPASSYQVVASVKDGAGKVRTENVTFSVAAVPDQQKLSFTVSPDDGTTVGIGEPISVHFYSAVTQRAAIERAMQVDAKTPGGVAVTGSWSWLNSQEVHWRPQSFWTPGTTVHLDMQIGGVQASANRYGRKDYSQTFTIGSSHITQVDASTHRLKIYRDGNLVDTWPTGTGRRGLETYSGTYIVLGKSAVVTMDSCSARITCDKKNPDYYNEKEYWATRITNSGTFLHAAGWDGLLGRANVSHGCIHLSDADAKDFYNGAVVGDVVIVKNTGRGPQERIATQDPGLYDWNVTWSTWMANSALH